jgi:hypothetical protein
MNLSYQKMLCVKLFGQKRKMEKRLPNDELNSIL